MKIPSANAGLATLALLLAAGVAAAQNRGNKPESLLPPGFDEQPQQQSSPQPAPAASRAPAAAPAAPSQNPSAPNPGGATSGVPVATPGNASGTAPSTAAPPVSGLANLLGYSLPDWARHPLTQIGPSTPATLGLPANAFGRADGRWLEALMRRLDAPIASRWLSIALRRALLSRVDTPARVNGADFAAERAWLLLRMGEAVAARAVVQSVDLPDYTPKLYQVGMQAELATADPAGLCGMVPGAQQQQLKERGWVLAEAMCTALAGRANAATKLLDQARRRMPSDIDFRLAEKLAGAGAQGNQAVTIQWAGVDRLTPWRFGLGNAMGEVLPDTLYDGVGPQVGYWYALLPGPDPRKRAADAERAAAQGVFSHSALLDLYGEIEEGNDSGPEVTIARSLRTAFTAPDSQDRLTALRTLWGQADNSRAHYGRMVLTARAAAAMPVGNATGDDQDRLIAAMLSAGLVPQAMQWQGKTASGSLANVLLALADPGSRLIERGALDSFAESAGQRKARMLLAGLAGLGRLSGRDIGASAKTLGIDLAAANAWTKAIDAAAQRGEAGTVVLLAAVGMQTRTWGAVPPAALFHIVSALEAVGLDGYARMIAVEAVTRS